MARVEDNMRRRTERAANNAGDQTENVMEFWSRLGFASRGLLYILLGLLPILLVFNGRGKITNQNGALATLAGQPFGKLLLTLIVIGLAGYTIYCFIRAIFDPFHKGKDAEGILARVGYFVTGLVYGSIVIPAYQLIRGTGSGGGGNQIQNFAGSVMRHPWGPGLVGLVGFVILCIGIYEIYYGWKEKFRQNFDSYKMNAEERKWATRMGRFGYIALGIVVGIIGFLTILAARTANPQQTGGIDTSLAFLLHQPYGPYLMAVVALGLIAYGIYSIMGAMWFRVKVK